MGFVLGWIGEKSAFFPPWNTAYIDEENIFSNKEARSSLTAHLGFCYVAMFQVFSLKVNKVEKLILPKNNSFIMS